MADTWLIVSIWSIFFNVLLLFGILGTKIGFQLYKLFWAKITWKWDKYQLVLFVNDSNVIKPKIVKKNESGGMFINKQLYSTNPKANYNLFGIPWQIIIDGVAEPIDVYGDPATKSMSTAEISRIVMNSKLDDLLGKIKQWVTYGLIGFLIAGGAMAVSLYFNWKIFDVVVQSGSGSVLEPSVFIPFVPKLWGGKDVKED